MVTSSQLEETSAVLQIYRWADSDSDPDFDKEPKAKTPHIVISSEEETPEVKNCTLFPHDVTIIIIIVFDSVKMQHKLRERLSTMSFPCLQGVLLDSSRFNPDS